MANEVGDPRGVSGDSSPETSSAEPPAHPRLTVVCDYSLGYLGGAQTALKRQVLALAELGWNVLVVAPGAPGAFSDAAPEVAARITTVAPRVFFTIPGVDLPVLPSRRTLVRELVRLAREHGTQGFVAHSEFTLAAAVLEAAGQLGLPMLQTVHTFFWQAPRPLGVFAPVVTAIHCAATGLPRNPRYPASTAINNALRSMTLRLALRAGGVLSPSAHQAEALREAGATRTRVLSNVLQPLAAVSAAPAPAGNADAQGDALTLVWAGRFAPEKRLDVAIEAVRLAREQGAKVHLHVAGGDHEPANGVTFHGRTTSEEVSALIDRSDAALLTSVGFDNQPMVALEAFARGRPVIVSDPVLAREFGGAAIDANGADAASLAATLMRLAVDPPAIAEAGDRALAYAAARQPAEHAKQLWAALTAAAPSNSR